MQDDRGGFEMKDRDGLARICTLATGHGTIETPTLMPVINPNRIIIPPGEMPKKFGAQAIITNSYILGKSMRDEVLEKGVHSLLGFQGPIMTDSGAFQM